jgi:hypothetical protein
MACLHCRACECTELDEQLPPGRLLVAAVKTRLSVHHYGMLPVLMLTGSVLLCPALCALQHGFFSQ